MSLGDPYRTLGNLLEEFDDRDIDVTAVDPKPIDGSPVDGPLEVRVTLSIPAGSETLPGEGTERSGADGGPNSKRSESATAGPIRSPRASDRRSDGAIGGPRPATEPGSSAATASEEASRTDGGSTAEIDSATSNPLDGGVALVRTVDEESESADESSNGDESESTLDEEGGPNAETRPIAAAGETAPDSTAPTTSANDAVDDGGRSENPVDRDPAIASEADPATADGPLSEDGEADRSASSDGEDRVACRGDNCDATFESEHGMKIHYAKVHAADGAAEKPAYTDPEALREVYERHETFAEMTRALGVDVTPATVRRHMIEQGIHEPNERQFDVSSAVENAIDAPDSDDAIGDSIEAADRPPEPDDRLPGDESEADSSEAETSAIDESETQSTVDTDESPIADRNRDGEGAQRRDETSETETIDAETIDGTADADGDSDSADADGDSNPTDPKIESEAEGPDTDEDVTNVSEVDDRADDVEYRVPDDVDLPSGVTLADVADAIETANTLYEVGRELRMSRERAQRLLRELDLLDLVVGRLATTDERERMRAIVDDRLRAANAAGEAA